MGWVALPLLVLGWQDSSASLRVSHNVEHQLNTDQYIQAAGQKQTKNCAKQINAIIPVLNKQNIYSAQEKNLS